MVSISSKIKCKAETLGSYKWGKTAVKVIVQGTWHFLLHAASDRRHNGISTSM